MNELLQTLLYAVTGFIIFMIALYLMEKITHFSIKDKIIDEGNIAMAIVLASIIASLGMIISSAIH